MSSVGEPRGALLPLTQEQLSAVQPISQVWLSAFAGTGKTQVLTARVLRLLLTPGVRPENLLCITFTKAGAAEMAERINDLLAQWVQMPPPQLAADLNAIGADFEREGPVMQQARQLFARVLDAPGGGLQIMTIHSLAQSILSSFPEEAGLIPGFKPIEGRELEALHDEVLAELVEDMEAQGRQDIIGHLQELSIAMGEDAAQTFLKKCASEAEIMEAVPEGGELPFARRIAQLDIDDQAAAQWLESQLADHAFDKNALVQLADLNAGWATKTGLGRTDAQRIWLGMNAKDRADNFDLLYYSVSTKSDSIQKGGPKDPAFAHIQQEIFDWLFGVKQQLILSDYADRLACALSAGKAYALRYAEVKKRRGVVDFDDMIRHSADLLEKPGVAEWIRFKLDQRIDHILVDEAQDTNRKQWSIIEALSDDFFAGKGAKEEKQRTIFSVGDFKQAIFGFQGTDPAQYQSAKERFAERIHAGGGVLEEATLSRSFRSTQPIISFVNALSENIPEDAMGDINLEPHFTDFPDIGSVELLQPVNPDLAEAPEDDQDWVADEKRLLAERIADRVKELVDEAPVIHNRNPDKSRRLLPGDIMILLRSRGELASSLIGQLHQRGVSVAGIDRLKMQEPLVVQDMLAAIRFVLQPEDDYSLACLMVSPLIGWDHTKLLNHGYRDKGKGLWEHLRGQNEISADIEPLRELLSMADFMTAHAFLEHILSGPMLGRRKFVGRLGDEALIPMEELINLSLQFESGGGGTLQAFLHWFESGETQITREQISGSNEVRVMTVHGSKGLQAPVVILGDVASDPTQSRDGWLPLDLDRFENDRKGRELPLIPVKKAEAIGRLEETKALKQKKDAQEHMRLLYVAATRAEEHLIMAGSLGPKAFKKEEGYIAPEQSWFPKLEQAMFALGCDWQDSPAFGQHMCYKGREQPTSADIKVEEADIAVTLPDWLIKPAPEESRPPKPLVPSALDDDDYGEAPATAKAQIAAQKGKFAHMLFERIGGDDLEQSLANAQKWLARQSLPDGLEQHEILQMVSATVQDPAYAEWFGQDARAEVPLAAVVGETVVSGRVDRLLITENLVSVLDFKTGSFVPDSPKKVPTAYLKQMASYVAALGVIFPQKKVEAALLFSHGPRLIRLPEKLLQPHKPAT